jgi:hypothetical protein
MTNITQEDIVLMQSIAAEERGISITVEEAEEAWQRMIGLYEFLMRPTAQEMAALRAEDNVAHLETRIAIHALKRGGHRGIRPPRPHVYPLQ